MGDNRPIRKWRSGNIQGAIWYNEREVDGSILGFKTFSLSRNWKKKGEETWRSDVINNLRRNDIGRLIVILNKVQEELYLEEHGDN